jgi:hypothetical protein
MKEDILNHVMEAEIKPVRRTVPGWRPAVVFACILAVFALLIVPRGKGTDMAEQAASEPAVIYEEPAGAMESAADAMDSAAESGYTAETLSEQLGYRIPDMSGFSDGSAAEYMALSDTQGQIRLVSDGNAVIIATERIVPGEADREETADGAVTEGANESIKTEDTVSQWSFEQDGILYRITFESPVSAETAAEIELFIRQDVK